jgi:hypothetical protein
MGRKTKKRQTAKVEKKIIKKNINNAHARLRIKTGKSINVLPTTKKNVFSGLSLHYQQNNDKVHQQYEKKNV